MTQSRRLPPIIDVHAHAILPGIISNLVSPQPAWSVADALALMDAHGIQASVLTLTDAASTFTGPNAADLARRTNEQLAEIVRQHPTRFAALASLPGRDMDGALSEMAYALDTLRLDGVGTFTSHADVYLGDDSYAPWFEEMNRRGVTLFCHPTGARASTAVDLGLHPSGLEYMFDTTRMLTNLVFSGAKARYSEIKIITTHGGGTLPYLATRLQLLSQVFGTGPGHAPLTQQQVRDGFASFFYDLTAATSAAQLFALTQLLPTTQLLLGFDFPYMPQRSIEPTQADVAAWDAFSDEDLKRIAHDNAAGLFPQLAARLNAAVPS